jgi:hypothetical protein
MPGRRTALPIASALRRLGAALVLVAGLGATPASALSYRLIEAELPTCRGACPKIIVASGTIRHNEHFSFMEFITGLSAEDRLSSMLVLESPGGFNSGASALGMLLRKLKMTVVVGRPIGGAVTPSTGLTAATCASACVLVLAGGTTRYFVQGSRVGVHRANMGPEIRDPTTRALVSGEVSHENVRNAYARYFRMMGVDQGLATVMDRTAADSMHWLSPAELGRFRLARNAATRR